MEEPLDPPWERKAMVIQPVVVQYVVAWLPYGLELDTNFLDILLVSGSLSVPETQRLLPEGNTSLHAEA